MAGSSEAHIPATLAAPYEGRPWVILCFTCGLRFLLFATREHGYLNILLKKQKKAVIWCLLMNCKLALRMEIIYLSVYLKEAWCNIVSLDLFYLL